MVAVTKVGTEFLVITHRVTSQDRLSITRLADGCLGGLNGMALLIRWRNALEHVSANVGIVCALKVGQS